MLRRCLILVALLLAASPAAAQNPFSLVQFGTTAVDTNSGNKSAGTLRVVIATDQPNLATPWNVTFGNTTIAVTNAGTFAVQAAQSGTWNIGTVTAVTAISNALPAGTNVIGHAIIDSGSTTAVTQATAASLNATVVGTGTFATQAAQSGTWTVQPGNTANTTAWKVDGSAVTQPASIADGSSVTLGAKADAKSTATDTTAVTIMSVLKEISAMEQAPASRAVTNAGTFVTQATLQTQTDTVMVGGVNVKEINAVTPLMGNGVTGTGSQRVTVASDNTPFAVKTDQTTHGTTDLVAADLTKIAGSTVVADPCQVNAKVYTPISQTTGTQLVTGTSAKKTYVCSVLIVAADAENVSLIAGTGTVCATNSVAVIGGTSAAAGPNLAANGGFVIGTGNSAIAATTVNADNLCLLQSGSGRVAGQLVSVVQ